MWNHFFIVPKFSLSRQRVVLICRMAKTIILQRCDVETITERCGHNGRRRQEVEDIVRPEDPILQAARIPSSLYTWPCSSSHPNQLGRRNGQNSSADIDQVGILPKPPICVPCTLRIVALNTDHGCRGTAIPRNLRNFCLLRPSLQETLWCLVSPLTVSAKEGR